MKRPKSRLISALRARTLLAQVKHSVDCELSESAMSEVYALEDGSALVILRDVKGRCRLYESHRELVEMNRKASVAWHADHTTRLLNCCRKVSISPHKSRVSFVNCPR